MRSFLLLCLLTVAMCKPATIFAPSVSYPVPFGVAASPGVAFAVPSDVAPVLPYQTIMAQSPGINTVTEYQAIPYYQNPVAVVSNFVYQ
uniref:Uncharacterized protein n=1 Tax=Anopheles funestus TaxID=62324 RepID=A0A182R4I8_ANOFN